MKNVLSYLTGRNGNSSMLNLNIRQNIRQDDTYEIIITDEYRYRIDKIAKDFIGSSDYHFFIIWINNIKNFDDIDSGKVIKIPTLNFIKKFRNEMKIMRGV